MLGFIVALIAGGVTPHLVEPVARPLARSVSREIQVEPDELRLVAFMIAMLVAALVAVTTDENNAFGLMLGGIVGYFGVRIGAMIRRAVDGRPRD